ncbi:hypothetical protein Y882_11705 [Dyella japonica DSM 16301]|uniref:Lysozyme inhibitor LprI N-terminal domain-containing protein n=1 Tax=Dyella japonica DSM 16301 TaxID=1440762 RepID=A0A0G9H2K1_9GAMM|nr:hypothetical protein Y882_11705 [Dyella japonica DSM 16301]
MAQGESVLLAGALLFLGLEGSISAEHSVASVINDCWKGHDHAGMSACVEARAKDAQMSLGQAERVAGDVIRASVDEAPGFPKYRREAMAGLHLASGAFSKYVASECSYEVSLAVKGNSSEDVRLACVAVPSEERAKLIRAAHPLP